MNKQQLFRFLLLGSLVFLTTPPFAVWGQNALERLEKQIRQRVEQEPSPPAPSTDLSDPKSPDSAPEPASPGKKWAPGYVGITVDDRQDRGRGIRVIGVASEGPAEKAGLKKDDLITAISGVRTRQMSEMDDVLQLYTVGESVEFEVFRNNNSVKLKVILEKRPPQKNIAEQAPEAIPHPPGDAILGKTPFDDNLSLPPPKELATESHPLANSDTHPTVEALLQRVEQLEHRVAELEKAFEASKKRKE